MTDSLYRYERSDAATGYAWVPATRAEVAGVSDVNLSDAQWYARVAGEPRRVSLRNGSTTSYRVTYTGAGA